MGKQTALYQRHVDAGAKLVDFGGWDMPLHYGSQIDEHHVVRNSAGMFDVSHMTVVDVVGPDSRVWLQFLLANDVGRLQKTGKGLYSCMLNPAGGVVDDLIVYWQGEDKYRVVVNAATREADLAWMHEMLGDKQVVLNERDDLAMIAVQGPQAREITAPLLPANAGKDALELAAFESIDLDGVLSRAPGIRVKMAGKFCLIWMLLTRFGLILSRQACAPVGWAPGILCVWKPGLTCTARI